MRWMLIGVLLGWMPLGTAVAQTINVSHETATLSWTIPAYTTENAPESHVITCGTTMYTVPMPAASVLARTFLPATGTYTCTLYAQNSAGRQAAANLPFPVFQTGYGPMAPTQLQVLEKPSTKPPGGSMAAPTRADYQASTFNNSTATTASVTWQTGDWVVVLGATEDNTLTMATPTATGLTFNPLSGTPTNTASNTKMYAWTAQAGSNGSGAISVSAASGIRGIAAWVWRGSGGIGNTSIQTGLGATSTQSLIRGSANSCVVQIWGDWGAGNDVTVTWTPSGQTQRIAVFNSGVVTYFVAEWGDQGSAGTTSYGFSAGNATAMSAITLEIKGTATAAASLVPPLNPMQPLLAR